jgi:hypothetical protein
MKSKNSAATSKQQVLAIESPQKKTSRPGTNAAGGIRGQQRREGPGEAGGRTAGAGRADLQ